MVCCYGFYSNVSQRSSSKRKDLKEAAQKRQAFIEGQEKQLRFGYVLPISTERSDEATG